MVRACLMPRAIRVGQDLVLRPMGKSALLARVRRGYPLTEATPWLRHVSGGLEGQSAELCAEARRGRAGAAQEAPAGRGDQVLRFATAVPGRDGDLRRGRELAGAAPPLRRGQPATASSAVASSPGHGVSDRHGPLGGAVTLAEGPTKLHVVRIAAPTRPTTDGGFRSRGRGQEPRPCSVRGRSASRPALRPPGGSGSRFRPRPPRAPAAEARARS